MQLPPWTPSTEFDCPPQRTECLLSICTYVTQQQSKYTVSSINEQQQCKCTIFTLFQRYTGTRCLIDCWLSHFKWPNKMSKPWIPNVKKWPKSNSDSKAKAKSYCRFDWTIKKCKCLTVCVWLYLCMQWVQRFEKLVHKCSAT